MNARERFRAGRAVQLPKAAVQVSATVGAARRAACRECEAFNGTLCELKFGCGVCLTRWIAWLDDPRSCCPQNPPYWREE